MGGGTAHCSDELRYAVRGSLTFGFNPEPGTMYLNQYSDFVTEIISETGSWPDGAAIEFRYLPSNVTTWITWPATITGATASWDVPAVDVAALLASGVTQYRLFYAVGSMELEWSIGQVVNVS